MRIYSAKVLLAAMLVIAALLLSACGDERVTGKGALTNLDFGLLQSGDVVSFGRYEQDNNHSNGRESIEWIVLNKNADGSLVLLSRYALDCRHYNDAAGKVRWENCTLRSWLNQDFYNTAFDAGERQRLSSRTAGVPEDRVWLLSANEAKNGYACLKDNDARMCAPTKFAVSHGAYTDLFNTVDGEGACWWWLRSLASDSNAPDVEADGLVSLTGFSAVNEKGGVCPVICIKPS